MVPFAALEVALAVAEVVDDDDATTELDMG
jgi:hypothetical protein